MTNNEPWKLQYDGLLELSGQLIALGELLKSTQTSSHHFQPNSFSGVGSLLLNISTELVSLTEELAEEDNCSDSKAALRPVYIEN